MFGLKKKKEILDLRPKDSDMPVPAKIRERLMAGGKTSIIAGNSVTDSFDAKPVENSTSSSSSGSGGGFFSFFGGGDSSTGSSVSSSETSSSIVSDNSSSQVNDLSYRLSRLLDRVELVEKKLERLERRSGSDSNL